MAVMSSKGDTKVIWDPNNQDEVAAARVQFETLRSKGFLAFKTTDDGEKGEQIRAFEPGARRIILTPPLRGGS